MLSFDVEKTKVATAAAIQLFGGSASKVAMESAINSNTERRFQPTPDHSLNFRAGVLAEIYEYWQEKCGKTRMPSRLDLDPVDLGRNLPHIALVDVFQDPFKLRWRLLGTHITQSTGRDVTNAYFENAYRHPLFNDMIEIYGECVRSRKPIRYFGTASFSGKDYLHFETGHFPLSSDGESVDMLFIGMVFGEPRERHP